MATDPRVPQSVDELTAPWNAPSIDHLDTHSWDCPICKSTLELRISRDDDGTFYIDEDAWYRQDKYGCDHERCNHAAEEVRNGPDGKLYCSGVCYSQAMYNALNPVRQEELKALYLALSQLKLFELSDDETVDLWLSQDTSYNDMLSLHQVRADLLHFMEGSPADNQPQWITDAEDAQ